MAVVVSGECRLRLLHICPVVHHISATALTGEVNLRWAWQMTRGERPTALARSGSLALGDCAARGSCVSRRCDHRGSHRALTFLATALFAVEVSAVSLSYRELTKGEESTI